MDLKTQALGSIKIEGGSDEDDGLGDAEDSSINEANDNSSLVENEIESCLDDNNSLDLNSQCAHCGVCLSRSVDKIKTIVICSAEFVARNALKSKPDEQPRIGILKALSEIFEGTHIFHSHMKKRTSQIWTSADRLNVSICMECANAVSKFYEAFHNVLSNASENSYILSKLRDYFLLYSRSNNVLPSRRKALQRKSNTKEPSEVTQTPSKSDIPQRTSQRQLAKENKRTLKRVVKTENSRTYDHDSDKSLQNFAEEVDGPNTSPSAYPPIGRKSEFACLLPVIIQPVSTVITL